MEDPIVRAIGKDEINKSLIIALTEHGHLVDSSFMLAHLANYSAKAGKTCVMLNFHNTVHHFTAVKSKLGLNYKCHYIDDVLIENRLENLEKKVDPYLLESDVAFFLEHPTDLILNGCSSYELFQFINKLSTNNSQLIISSKNLYSCKDLEFFINELKHISDVRVDLFSLKTGTAKDVSGFFRVYKSDTKPSEREFHYQLLERKVRVFLPGQIN